ncbi:MAG: hypothetical protein ACI3U8_00445 [Candidatus Onthomonas sp.]
MGNGSGCKTWDMRYAESQQRTAAMFQFMQKENAKYKWYQVPPCPQPRPKDEVELGGVPVCGCFEKHGSFAPGTVFEREVNVNGKKEYYVMLRRKRIYLLR